MDVCYGNCSGGNDMQNDLISRQAVINIIDSYMDKSVELHYLPTVDSIKRLISILPSVQPEIIRCKECKHACLTYRGEVKYCEVWTDDTLYMDGDNFCSFAEREEVKG